MARGFAGVVHRNGEVWDAEVVRRRGRKRPKVERSRSGFASREEAQAWADAGAAEMIVQRKEREAAEARKAEERAAETKAKRQARLEALAERLQAMHPDVYVIDGAACGYGLYTLKIETPISVYLSTGTEADWVRLVKQDIEAAQSFSCLFCGSKMGWERDGSEKVSCPGCGAKGERDPKRLADALGLGDLPADDALYVLENLCEFVREDSRHGLWWGVPPPALPKRAAGRRFEAIEGPDDGPGTGELPLVVDADTASENALDAMRLAADATTVLRLAEAEEWDCVSLATCRFCIHAAEVMDNSDAILGVEDSFWCNSRPVCVHSHEGPKLQEEHPAAFEFEPEKMRGHRTNDRGIIRNILVAQVLAATFDVEERRRGLEARVGKPINDFHGPICRNFRLNPDHLNLQGCPYEVLPVTVPVQYGLVDARRERDERGSARAREDAARVWREAEAAIRAMLDDPERHEVLKTRIEMRNLSSQAAERLVALLEDSVPIEARRTGALCTHFPWAFDLSSSASKRLDERLAERARAASLQ